jgi:type IV pilus assembly protein PilV
MKNYKKNLHVGFTLLEVLVAVLVLSFGLLGIAGLLLSTVQNNTIAAQRTTATFLAQDMADRIRQNINATKPFGPDGKTPQPVYYINSAGVDLNCYGPTPTGVCSTPQNTANRDLFVWNALIQNSLPGGEGVVCQDLTPDDGYRLSFPQCDNLVTSPWVIKIFWTVRPEDQVNKATTTNQNNIQRFSMMMGGT